MKSIPLRLLVPRWPVRRAVPHGEEVVVTRNVTVPRQVVWVLEVTGTPATGVLDHADGGLWESKEKWVMAPSSAPGAVITLLMRFGTSTEQQLPKPSVPLAALWTLHGRDQTAPRQGVPKDPQTTSSKVQYFLQNRATGLCSSLK